MTIKLMDANELNVIAEVEIDSRLRSPRLEHNGKFFEASRQEADGAWIYRFIPTTR